MKIQKNQSKKIKKIFEKKVPIFCPDQECIKDIDL